MPVKEEFKTKYREYNTFAEAITDFASNHAIPADYVNLVPVQGVDAINHHLYLEDLQAEIITVLYVECFIWAQGGSNAQGQGCDEFDADDLTDS